jgi:hypothetical protein
MKSNSVCLHPITFARDLDVADKKQIKPESVNVTVSSVDHQIIEHGAAQRDTTSEWCYQSKLSSRTPYTSYVIRITATDMTGQSADKTISCSVLFPLNAVVYP